MHSYLGMVWFAVHFCHKACGISRTNCQGQSWNKLCNVCRTICQNKLLMFAGTIYLLDVTLCSSFAHFGRWARLAAFQPSRGPLDHSRKWFHWKGVLVPLLGPNPLPELINNKARSGILISVLLVSARAGSIYKVSSSYLIYSKSYPPCMKMKKQSAI